MDKLFKKGGSRGYVTLKDFSWKIHKKYKYCSWVLHIPAGREFENSVPTFSYKSARLQKILGGFQPFHWIISPDDPRFLIAALIHDILLERGYSKKFSDSQWLQVNKEANAPMWRTYLGYFGIKLLRLFQNE